TWRRESGNDATPASTGVESRKEGRKEGRREGSFDSRVAARSGRSSAWLALSAERVADGVLSSEARAPRNSRADGSARRSVFPGPEERPGSGARGLLRGPRALRHVGTRSPETTRPRLAPGSSRGRKEGRKGVSIRES